jgi:hypothetical protein
MVKGSAAANQPQVEVRGAAGIDSNREDLETFVAVNSSPIGTHSSWTPRTRHNRKLPPHAASERGGWCADARGVAEECCSFSGYSLGR